MGLTSPPTSSFPNHLQPPLPTSAGSHSDVLVGSDCSAASLISLAALAPSPSSAPATSQPPSVTTSESLFFSGISQYHLHLSPSLHHRLSLDLLIQHPPTPRPPRRPRHRASYLSSRASTRRLFPFRRRPTAPRHSPTAPPRRGPQELRLLYRIQRHPTLDPGSSHRCEPPPTPSRRDLTTQHLSSPRSSPILNSRLNPTPPPLNATTSSGLSESKARSSIPATLRPFLRPSPSSIHAIHHRLTCGSSSPIEPVPPHLDPLPTTASPVI